MKCKPSTVCMGQQHLCFTLNLSRILCEYWSACFYYIRSPTMIFFSLCTKKAHIPRISQDIVCRTTPKLNFGNTLIVALALHFFVLCYPLHVLGESAVATADPDGEQRVGGFAPSVWTQYSCTAGSSPLPPSACLREGVRIKIPSLKRRLAHEKSSKMFGVVCPGKGCGVGCCSRMRCSRMHLCTFARGHLEKEAK